METIIDTSVDVAQFVKELEKLSFDEVTTEKLQELYPIENPKVDDLSEVENLKDIYFDNVAFTVYRRNNAEGVYSGIALNNTLVIGKLVEVWIRNDKGEEWQEDAEICYSNKSFAPTLRVTVTI